MADPAPAVAGLLLSDDLLFTSRILGTARDLGFPMKAVRTPAVLTALAAEHAPRGVILDLAHPGLVIGDVVRALQAAAPGVRVIAYGSHVDTATLGAAREAGCDVVLPRSRFVEDLPRQLPVWLAGPDAPPP
jgi:DNA-binding NarL/FixJ family response regulator